MFRQVSAINAEEVAHMILSVLSLPIHSCQSMTAKVCLQRLADSN